MANFHVAGSARVLPWLEAVPICNHMLLMFLLNIEYSHNQHGG